MRLGLFWNLFVANVLAHREMSYCSLPTHAHLYLVEGQYEWGPMRTVKFESQGLEKNMKNKMEASKRLKFQT